MSGIAQYTTPAVFTGTITNSPITPSPSDAHVPVNGDLFALQGMYNGANWDQVRNNYPFLILASAVRSAGATSPIFKNYNHRGLLVNIDVTAIGTGDITLKIFNVSFSGAITAALLAVPVTAIGKYTYHVCPGIGAASASSGVTLANSGCIDRSFEIIVSKSDGSNWTYSVEGTLIL